MFWRVFASLIRQSVTVPPPSVTVLLDGWAEAKPSGEQRVWRNADGDVLSFAHRAYLEIPQLNDLNRVRNWCRDLAESASGGLVDVNVFDTAFGHTSFEQYQRSWAHDPYDPDYAGVDHSALRFMSDDARYDVRFPDHPLTKVRKALAELPRAVRVEAES